MERNWDTVRSILIKLAQLPNTDTDLSLDDFGCSNDDEAYDISYNMELLIEAGFVQGVLHKYLDGGPTDFTASKLTWSGNDYLQAIRNDTVWNKTKDTFKSKGLEMTLELIKSVAIGITAKMLNLPS